MSVYRPSPTSRTYVYDFWWLGVRQKDSTYQTTKKAALLVEAKKKLELREQAGGLTPLTVADTPTFSAWAEVALRYQTQFITRPDVLKRTLRMVLGFWGAKPTRPIGHAAVARPELVPRPYHNLRLGDAILDPTWLEAFEAWMLARGVSGSTRNTYLSACSDLYACALQPQYRASTGVATNPFAGIRRSPRRKRIIALTPEQILALVGAARARHIAHALCIAALAPKLRVASILKLEWARHLDAELTTITVEEHKTSRATGLAQVVPVSDQLREILRIIRTKQLPTTTHVITWRGEPIASIKTGLRRAVKAIGLPWGLKNGVTFHVMRHSIATLLANPKLVGALTERIRADVMGHGEIRTTQQYTHLNTSVQEGPHESLSAALPGLRAAVADKDVRRSGGGKSGGPQKSQSGKPLQKRVLSFGSATHRKRA